MTATSLLISCSDQKFAVEEESNNFGQRVTYNTQVDVLFVVDTSSSMGPRQTLLANQVPAFLKGLNDTGLDYHIGVTTMDMSSNGQRGKLLAGAGEPRVLTKATANLGSVLANRIQAGETGSPVERGQEAMIEAVRLSTLGDYNEGFLRDQALFNVVFLSDEEDQSDSSVNYIDALDFIKPLLPYGDRSWITHLIGIMPSDPSCQTADWQYSSPGLRYMELATQSFGTVSSICDADFKKALTNVRSRILEVTTDFPLARRPLVETIRVFINGIEIPKSETNGWTYRETVNMIRFHGTAIPKDGSRIRVDFDPAELK